MKRVLPGKVLARVCCISHARPQNVPKIEKLFGAPVVWYVGKNEAAAYTRAGAQSVKESGGLCESRNAALRDCFGDCLYCVQISDDLARVSRAHTILGEHRVAMQYTLREAIEQMLLFLSSDTAHLAGCAPTDNPYFCSDPVVKTNKFIVGDLIAVKPCPLFFDEKLKLKEDYDYTLQHLREFGRALRLDYLLPTFAHRTNPGGAVEFRTSEREQQAITYLKKKWPGCIKDNPKRPNEILMAWRAHGWFLKKGFR